MHDGQGAARRRCPVVRVPRGGKVARFPVLLPVGCNRLPDIVAGVSLIYKVWKLSNATQACPPKPSSHGGDVAGGRQRDAGNNRQQTAESSRTARWPAGWQRDHGDQFAALLRSRPREHERQEGRSKMLVCECPTQRRHFQLPAAAVAAAATCRAGGSSAAAATGGGWSVCSPRVACPAATHRAWRLGSCLQQRRQQ